MPGKSHPIDCLCSKPFGCSSKMILSMMLLKCCSSLSFAARIVMLFVTVGQFLFNIFCLQIFPPRVALKLIHCMPKFSLLFFSVSFLFPQYLILYFSLITYIQPNAATMRGGKRGRHFCLNSFAFAIIILPTAFRSF